MNQQEQHEEQHGSKQGWRQGVSQPHKRPCRQCQGLQHPRGRHYSPGQIPYLLQKQRAKLAHREADRAAAERFQAEQAG